MNKIGFGGGCHWCTEAVFQSLRGVETVAQGWIASSSPNDAFSEAVIVTFDSEEIELSTLIQVHLMTHSSESVHPLRHKYRSAIYYDDEVMRIAAQDILDQIKSEWNRPFVTQILPLVEFKENQEKYLNYYQKNPTAPFCKNYIDPKLSLIKQQFSKNSKV